MTNDIVCIGLTRTELQTLFALTKCTFEALLDQYDVHCPGQFDKLYAADITDV